METKSILNKALNLYAEKTGFSDAQMAKKLGINTTTIWRWRRGERLGKALPILLPILRNYLATNEEEE